MKRLKIIAKYLFLVLLLVFLFRGFLYRYLINYSIVGVRRNHLLVDTDLFLEIDKQTIGEKQKIDEIVQLSHRITSKKLRFTFTKVEDNSNSVLRGKRANCVGYASLFNSIFNYIIKKQKLSDSYECVHLVGKLDFLGMDIHKLFDSPFFKDHDFNSIRNKITEEKKFVDPSLRDYLYIDYVTCK